MVQLTVRKVGNSLGVTLPAQAAQTLHVKEGDKLSPHRGAGWLPSYPIRPSLRRRWKLPRTS